MSAKRKKHHPKSPVTATLSFDLTSPEGRDGHRQACAAPDICAVLWEIDQYLRNAVKHGVPPSENGPDACDKARDFLHAELYDRGLNLDELVF